jgi:S-DNA-T family DNA segregation ATPase FtsK/SpoIIIE
MFDRAADVQSALGLHLLHPYKEGDSIYLAVSESEIMENRLLKILRNPLFYESKKKIPLALGYDLLGNMHIADLTKLYHLLVVGPTGTGKSVALQCIILSIIAKCPVNDVRLVLFDIGSDSLSLFSKVKHLYHDIVKDVNEGIIVMDSLVVELNRRIDLGEEACQSLPFIVCIIDEFDDTIGSIDDREDARKFISSINSLILKGRKYKIILILASHDPTLKNTKVKINLIIPRIVFQLGKHHNSSTALGVTGADKLPGKGAMLFKSQKGIMFLQGSWVTSEEIEKILNNAPVGYDEINKLQIVGSETMHLQATVDGIVNYTATDKSSKELADIIFWVLGCATISVRQIQQQFKIGNRATEIIDTLHDMNIITAKFANQPRKVLPVCLEDLPSEIQSLMERNDYSSEMIEKVLNDKVGGGQIIQL